MDNATDEQKGEGGEGSYDFASQRLPSEGRGLEGGMERG